MRTFLRHVVARSVMLGIASLPLFYNSALAQNMQSKIVATPEGGSVPKVEVLPSSTTTTLKNPGKDSVQLLWHKNSPEARMTITRVTMQPKAVSDRHSHPTSEQEWIVESGNGTLLLASDETKPIRAGDVVRTPAGAVHGVVNSGAVPLVYISVTTPPEDFSKFYSGSGSSK